MRNRTDIVGISIPDRLRQLLRTYSGAVEFTFVALLGFLMSGSSVAGGLSPFGAAFFAASGPGYSLAAAIGSCTGYLFSANSFVNMKYIAAIVIIAAFKWAIKITRVKIPAVAEPSLLTLVGLGITGVSLLSASRGDGYGVVLTLSELVLAGGAAYFFARAMRAADSGTPLPELERADLSCVIITLCIMVMAMSNMKIAEISAGRMIAVVIILCAAYFGAESGGAVAGITAGSAMALVGGGQSFLIAAYGFGGLIAGVFSGFGRFGSAVAFVLINGFGVIIAGAPLTMLYEVFAASVVFMLLPRRVLEPLLLTRTHTAAGEPGTMAMVQARLAQAHRALEEIGVSTRLVSEKLSEIAPADSSLIFSRAADRVCKSCKAHPICWQQNYNDTLSVMNGLLPALKKSGEIEQDDFPEYFIGVCRQPEEFVRAINTEYGDFFASQSKKRSSCELRSVVSEQFEGVSELIAGISADLQKMQAQDARTTRGVHEYFYKNGLQPAQTLCYRGAAGRICIETRIPTYKLPRLLEETSAKELGVLCGAKMDIPEIQKGERQTVLYYREMPLYSAVFAHAQISSSPRICGDSFKQFYDRERTVHMMISDGMGTGGLAALDSAMTISLMSRLIEAGTRMDTALKLVNSALVVKSSAESLATLDVVKVDPYTGETVFHKAGAAPSFVKKGGRTGYVESTSLPAGILSGVEFETASITLADGDMIVLVSDGVTVSGMDWVKAEIQNFKGSDPQQLCDALVKAAALRRTDGRTDDITAAALCLYANAGRHEKKE